MALPVFDTHAHLDLEQFAGDIDDIVSRIEQGAFPEGFVPEELRDRSIDVVGVLLPGIDLASSQACVSLTSRSPKLHAAVAVHPNSVVEIGPVDWSRLIALAERDEVVAIGETGLDRYWDRTPFDMQLDYFRRHFELAVKTRKPVLIHCRDAWNDMLPILREFGGNPGVIHAFSGDVVQAEEAVRLGFHVSFAGSLSYRNVKFSPLWEAAKHVPLHRLLIETDSPYLIPHPFRGKLRRNEPTLAASVAIRLAELRGESLETICEATTQNACELFGIGR